MLLGKGVIRQETGGRNAFASEPDVVKTWRFTIKLQLRDGRYKVDIYDFDYSFEQPAYSHMPGLKPTTRNLDTFYSDRKTYKKDGTLQRGAPTNIANWTNETFIAMLANIKSAMAREVAADDF